MKFGSKHTEKTKLKISETKKSKPHCWRGKTLPEYLKTKMAQSRRRGKYINCKNCNSLFWVVPSWIKKGDGKFCSRKCYFIWQKGKEKINKTTRNTIGIKNPNWKGGITPLNTKIRNSEKFRIWRETIFKRDNWTCRRCGKRSKKNEYLRIEAHHVKPFATFPELRFVIDNGLTLCKKCHDKEPKGKQIYDKNS